MFGDNLNSICKEWPEILVYYAIDQLGGFIFHMNHDMSHGRIPEASWPAIDADILIARNESKQIVQSLTRFGLEKPTDEEGHPTPEYWKWFQWWNDYSKSMTKDQFAAMEKATDEYVAAAANLAKCRPEGTWKTAE